MPAENKNMIDVFENSFVTPALVVTSFARGQAMEALQTRISQVQAGGWDGGHTRGRNVKSYVSGDVGIIEVNGLLWTHDDFRAYMYGFTTYESIALEIVAMKDAGVRGLILSINSPGGLVPGVDELAEYIYASRSDFDFGIHAHVLGSAESGAYWLAAACDSIVMNATSQVGSIGAVLGVYKDNSGGPRVVEFISSRAPLKRVSPTSEEGKEEYQKNVDAVEDVFVASVARYRGLSVETVLSDFGNGGSFVGVQAVNAGMADSIGSLESIISDMGAASAVTQGNGVNDMAVQGKKTNAGQTPAAHTPAADSGGGDSVNVDAITNDAIANERARVSGIVSALTGTPLADKAGEYIASGASVGDVNSALVEHYKSVPPKASAPVTDDADDDGDDIPVPSVTGAAAAARKGAKLGALDAMRAESGAVSGVGTGAAGGSRLSGEEQQRAEELKMVSAAWGSSAKEVIKRGYERRQ